MAHQSATRSEVSRGRGNEDTPRPDGFISPSGPQKRKLLDCVSLPTRLKKPRQVPTGDAPAPDTEFTKRDPCAPAFHERGRKVERSASVPAAPRARSSARIAKANSQTTLVSATPDRARPTKRRRRRSASPKRARARHASPESISAASSDDAPPRERVYTQKEVDTLLRDFKSALHKETAAREAAEHAFRCEKRKRILAERALREASASVTPPPQPAPRGRARDDKHGSVGRAPGRAASVASSVAGTELVEAALTVPASRTQTPARSRSVPVSARTSEVAVTMTPRARAMRFIGSLASSVNNILPKP